MARSNDALSVVDVLAASGGMQGLKDVLSTVVQDALQDLIEAEVTARLGAGRWERSEERSGTRNGSRPRTVSTPAGDVEVRIPKLRKVRYFPELLESRRRVDRALWGGDHDRLRHGHVHTEDRRPRQSAGLRVGRVEVDGVADLRGHRP